MVFFPNQRKSLSPGFLLLKKRAIRPSLPAVPQPIFQLICCLPKTWGLLNQPIPFLLPLGATINMGGAAITISTMTLAAVPHIRYASFASTNFNFVYPFCFKCLWCQWNCRRIILLIPLACSLFGISNDIAIQVVGVGLLLELVQDAN